MTNTNSNNSKDSTSTNLVDSTKDNNSKNDKSMTDITNGYISGDTRRSSTAHQFQSSNESSSNIK